MSSETLNQNEIDALLRRPARQPDGVDSVPAPRSAAPDAQVYDFRRPHRLSKEKLRALSAMYERLVKSLEAWLFGRVRGALEPRLLSVEQYSFGEFLLSLPTPCASYTFDIAESGGLQGVIDVGQDLAFFLVDRLFGGSGTTLVPSRSMSPIERMAVRVLAERVMHLVSEIWRENVDLQLNLSGFESIPEILRAANREDQVLVANIEVTVIDRTSLVVVCLPCSVLEKFFSSTDTRRVMTTGNASEQSSTRLLTEASLRAARVPVAARFRSFSLTLRQLAALAPGTVVPTGIPTSAALDVLVGSQARFRGAPGRSDGYVGVQILGAIEEPRIPSPPDHHPMSATQPRPAADVVNLDELQNQASPNDEVPLSMLMDLMLPVSIELGRTSMTVQEILHLGRGSVVQLERLAGEPVDVYVGERRFAEAEVVVLGEYFGVRITRILARNRPLLAAS